MDPKRTKRESEMKDMPTYTLKAVIQMWQEWQRQRIAIANRLLKASNNEAYLTPYDVKMNEQTIEDMKKLEHEAELRVRRVVREHPMWPWLKSIRGISEVLAGAMLSQFCITDTREVPDKKTGEIQIRKGAPRPSCWWSFAGLGTKDGRAPKREKGCEQSDGRKGLAYNSWLRTVIVGRVGPSFIKAKNEKYVPIYEGYKARLQARGTCSLEKHKSAGSIAEWYPSGSKGAKPQPGDFCTKGHMHNQAIRYMVKMFLVDFWTEWRKVEGLEVVPPYSEAKLGLKHSG